MIKAKDFWDFYCKEKGVRFFSGIPTKFFKPIYATMDKDVMFYIPAVNVDSAIGLVNGVSLSGDGAGLFLSSDNVLRIVYDLKSFNLKLDIPFLIWTDPFSDFSGAGLEFNYVNNENFKNFDHGILVVEKGFKK